MSIRIRMRGKVRNGVADIKALIKHPMESGRRKNKKTGKNYPAKFIDLVEVTINGTKAVEGQWSGAVSANPYMAVKVKANKGDEVVLTVHDNTGETGTKKYKLR